MSFSIAQIEQLPNFDTLIDVRSPSEFAQDHLYGAVNYPVLSDEQRAEVGLLHKDHVFEARRLGAAYISQNMGQLLQTVLAQQDKSWRPLVYCWRGGMRSGSAAHIMSKIGWRVHQLQGGYKSYRRWVLAQLETLPRQFNFIVVCGPTGSGKSRFLNALAAQGHQVLDLEGLAKHRGSLLGLIPGDVQPSQRYFESCLLHAMQQFDIAHPVFIESESKRIGSITLPLMLFEKMHESACVELLVPQEERIRFLCEDYHFYIENPALLMEKIQRLAPYHSKKELQDWLGLIEHSAFPALLKELLEKHYDPLYERSIHKHYTQLAVADKLVLPQLDDAMLMRVVETYCCS